MDADANAMPVNPEEVDALRRVLERRRAIRDFGPTPLPIGALRAILAEGALAPSSLGLQPYVLHLVVEPELRGRVAAVCNGQRAARTAAALVVVEVGPTVSERRIAEGRAYYASAVLPPRSREYHLAGLAKVALAHRRWLRPLLGAGRVLLGWVKPARSLLPLGSQGLRDWGARNAMLAVEGMMLAAAARGIDSCPMEGFDGAAVARLLGLPRSSAAAVVVAFGYRATEARIEPRFRRSLAQIVVEH